MQDNRMQKLIIILSILLVLSCERYHVEGYVVNFDEPELTIYQIASIETGCPEWVLVGLRYAESSFGKNIEHPDEYDTGDYGLHEKPSYRAERVEMCGDYNPYCPLDSAIVAGHIIMEHYEKMGDMEQAISAYRHGRVGTYRNGIDWQYVSRVKYGWSLYCSI